MRQKDTKVRKEYEKQQKEAEQKSIEAGKKSRKEEAFRIGGKALRAVLMQLLAELVREIISKMIKWFKSSKKTLDSLLDRLKEAIHSFVGQMKKHLINAGNTVLNTVATAIFGPIFRMINNMWLMFKQGLKSLKESIDYIKRPENKYKPIGYLILEIGKIVMTGLVGVGGILLGQTIETGLMTIPIFAVEIPLIGSLANILGIFFGAVVAGIIGAIVINFIDKVIEKRLKSENLKAQINKGNEILNLQRNIQAVNEVRLEYKKFNFAKKIKERNCIANDIMYNSLKNIVNNCKKDETIEDTFNDIDRLLKEL